MKNCEVIKKRFVFGELKMKKTKQVLHKTHTIQPHLILAIIGMWITLNFFFMNKYVEVIKLQHDFITRIFAGVVISWIILTSFYASFHLMSFLFSFIMRRKGNKIVRSYENTPAVAILYPCMNDIKENSILACLAQDYPDYTLYILDDSTEVSEHKRVDDLGRKYGKYVSIIRRKENKGFKAGNINNALRMIGNRYKYICVVDADEQIPPTFIRETVAILEGNKNIGFVQASHRQYSETKYGKLTGDGIDLHWNYFLPARNRFGFVYYYGHGAMLRYQAINDVGGFPEVVSEDLALTVKLRESGYLGYYDHDIKCYEETPPSYHAFRRRNKKVVSGTLEFLTKFYPSFLRSSNVSIIEKIDLLISSSIIYLPIPFVCFLILLHCIIPFFGEGSHIMLIHPFTQDNEFYIRKVSKMFLPLWKWDFMFFVFFTVFSPFFYLIPNVLRTPWKAILYFLRMGAINLSMCIHTIWTTLCWFINRRTTFISTGDRSQRSNSSFIKYLECLIGFLMITLGGFSGSFCLLAVGLSLVLVPSLTKNNLDGRLAMTVVIFPMIMTIIALCGVPIVIIGMTGIFTGLAFAHH